MIWHQRVILKQDLPNPPLKKIWCIKVLVMRISTFWKSIMTVHRSSISITQKLHFLTLKCWIKLADNWHIFTSRQVPNATKQTVGISVSISLKSISTHGVSSTSLSNVQNWKISLSLILLSSTTTLKSRVNKSLTLRLIPSRMKAGMRSSIVYPIFATSPLEQPTLSMWLWLICPTISWTTLII